jgi:membrane metallo-endopeptidase-like protein 1
VRWTANNPKEPNIFGLPYTPKQLFWVSYAQKWCGKNRDEKLKQVLLTTAFSPLHFRVLGTVSNDENVANDFNCALGSNMNPKTKCSVW